MFSLLIGIVVSGVVILISKFENKSRLPKYVPTIILFLVGAAFIVKAKYFSQSMEDLGYIVLTIMAMSSGALTLITAVVIDVLKKYRKK